MPIPDNNNYHMKTFFSTILFAAAAALAGCMMNPDYQSPAQSEQIRAAVDFENFENAPDEWKKASPRDTDERGDWWAMFADDTLSRFMVLCAENNPDVKSLLYKSEQAAEHALMTRSALFPHAGAGADYFKSEFGNRSLFTPLGSRFEDWAVGATLTWDADLFGRIRSTLEASRAEAQSVELQYQNALLALRTKTAALYFTYRQLQNQEKILEKTVEIFKAQTRFVLDKVEMQSASQADAERAKAQQYSAMSRLTDIAQKKAAVKNILAALLGTVPAKLEMPPQKSGFKSPQIPAAVPSALLERRADIAAAERQVRAANYRIGAAQAAFFPTISITSSLGTESTAFSKLLNSNSFAWGVSPQIYVPIFQAGRLCAQKRVALAKHKQCLEDYKSAVLNAVRETEDALAKTSLSRRRYAEISAMAQAAQNAESIVKIQYEEGVADFFQLCEANRAALSAKLALEDAAAERLRAAVELVRALGGAPENGKTTE